MINRIAEATVLNGIVQSAPGDSLIPFYCRRDFWESSLTAESGPYTHIVDVPSLRFADVLEEHKPNVLIMDIEGGELPLLLGLKQMSHVRAIVAEIHENVYGEGGLGQLIAAVARLGFVEDASGAARAVRTWVRTSH